MSEADVYCECGEGFEDMDAFTDHLDAAGGDEHRPADGTPQTAEAWETAGIREELNTILPGSDPLQNLHVKHMGACKYRVLSARNGSATYYDVELDESPTCTCPDMEYNRSDGDHDVCAHVCAAMLADRMSTEALAGQITMDLLSRLNGAVQDAEAAADTLQDLQVTARSLEADAVAESGCQSAASDTGGADTGPDAGAAADRLQEAFDDVLEDMEVQASAGHVWFQTGQDTPDDWPYPGGDETFQVVTGPDCVKYVHDGSADWAESPHPLYDDKPGEWWKNALEPGDVDQYISEVLE